MAKKAESPTRPIAVGKHGMPSENAAANRLQGFSDGLFEMD
ncbi:hypothetical protein [Neisseria animaloris]|nr:hypothetical protein [Neisseria animaloris]